MTTITQKSPSCKGAKEKLGGILSSVKFEHAVAAEILSGTNEKAMEILRICDCKRIIPVPKVYFTTVEEMAGFYRVPDTYLKGILIRLGINFTNMPDDVKRGSFIRECLMGMREPVAGRHIVGRYEVFNTPKGLRFCDLAQKRDNQTDIQITANRAVYSARVFLALDALMYYGRYITEGSVGGQVFSVLLKSDYANAAVERIKRIRKNGSAEETAEETEDMPIQDEHLVETPDGVVVTADGNFVISVELFARTIRTAVKEGVSEAIKGIQS